MQSHLGEFTRGLDCLAEELGLCSEHSREAAMGLLVWGCHWHPENVTAEGPESMRPKPYRKDEEARPTERNAHNLPEHGCRARETPSPPPPVGSGTGSPGKTVRLPLKPTTAWHPLSRSQDTGLPFDCSTPVCASATYEMDTDLGEEGRAGFSL